LNFFLKAPVQSSSSSREPSPVSNTLDRSEIKQSKRRYEPNLKNRRRRQAEEDLFCASADDSNFGDFLIRSKDQCSIPQSPSSPLITLPSKKLHGSARKLSIRRHQRSRMTFGGYFASICLFELHLEEHETLSGDEMSNRELLHCNLKKSYSGSLPTIVQDICKY
jgi:hypothetical protein